MPQFLIKVLEGIAKNLPELIKVAIDVLMAFFSGIVDAPENSFIASPNGTSSVANSDDWMQML